jgi:hypothetical protein
MFSGLYEQVNKTFVNIRNPKEDLVYRDSSQMPVFQDYTQRPVIGFDRTIYGDKAKTLGVALSEDTQPGKLHVTTRDIYLKGPVDRYDFCTELLDSTPGPFPLECLQSEFIRQGGQATGSMYPTNENIQRWNYNKKWLHVKDEIQTIITNTLSLTKDVKENAMLQFYGVGLGKEPVAIDPQYGVEIFWFTHHTDITMPTTFLGRRIRPMITHINNPTDSPGSMLFFTSVIVNKWSKAQYRVTSTNGFSLYFNTPITRVYNNKIVSTTSELSSLHNGGNTTEVSSILQLSPDINRLNGFYYYGKGYTYFKLEVECDEYGPGWKEIPQTHLQLTQEPFAPMVSFEVERSPATWGCDYPLCDKRLGGFKMKWENDGWGGPAIQYRGESVNQIQFPLKKNYLSFPEGRCAIRSKFSFTLSSFSTLTILITMKSCPPMGKVAMPLTLWGPAGAAPTLKVSALNESEAVLNLGTYKSSHITTDGPMIRKGEPTLVVLRILRKNEMDPKSIYSLQIAAAPVKDLQKSPKKLRESLPIALPNLISDEPSYFKIQSENMGFDLFWIHLFDYKLENDRLYREARADWGFLP